VRYGVLVFLCVLSFLSYFDRVCIMQAHGEIERDLHITESQMGSIMSAFWLAYAIFDIPGGWMGERFGARKTLTRIVLAWSIFTALTGSAVGFVSLYTYRFLFGLGEAGAYPNMARVQSRWIPPQHQGRVSGAIWLLARWGGAFSPFLFIALSQRVNSHAFRHFLYALGLHSVSTLPAWRLAFWTCGLFGVAWVLLFYPWFRDHPADHPSVNAAELQCITAGALPARARPRYNRRIWASLFLSRNLWAMAIFQALGSFGWSFFVSWLTTFLYRQYSVDYSHSGLLSALPLFCGGIACLVGGWISDRIIRITGRQRFGRAVLPICGRLVCAASIFAVRYAPSPTIAIAFMCVTMIAYDLGQGPNWAAIIEVGGIYAGIATGFTNTIGNLGNILQPRIGQWIFSHFGWNSLFTVFTVIYLLSGSMWLIVDPKRRFYRDEDVPAATEPGEFPV
jgi:MFS family permease